MEMKVDVVMGLFYFCFFVFFFWGVKEYGKNSAVSSSDLVFSSGLSIV